MILTVDVEVEIDPFGIPMFKTREHVRKVLDLGTINEGINLQLPGLPVSAYVSAELVPDATPGTAEDLDVDVRLSVYGVVIYNYAKTVLAHVKDSTYAIKEGGGQFTVTGTLTIAG